MKEFKIRGIEETSLVEYSKKLQSVLNSMEMNGFIYEMSSSGVDPRIVGGKECFLALVSGYRTRQLKPSSHQEETVSEEKETE